MIALSKGEQQVAVLRAKSIADAKVMVAGAEAEAIKVVGASLSEFGVDPTLYLIGLKYLEAFTEIGARASEREIFFPYMPDIGNPSALLKS